MTDGSAGILGAESLAGLLTIDLGAVARNWRALDGLSEAGVETAAVVKADAYGLGAERVAPVLAEAGARTFFAALVAEAVALRGILGPGPAIYVLSGYPVGEEARAFPAHDLRPVLNAPHEVAAWAAHHPERPAALQLDTGMNRLGLEPGELAEIEPPPGIALVMSHLATADAPGDPMTTAQLGTFWQMTSGLPSGITRSLAATGGTCLGPAFHFGMTRPGVGLFGGHPFAAAAPVVSLSLPILQIRDVAAGEGVGYGGTWRAARPSRIATLSGGYADGLHRLLGNRATGYVAGEPCPFAGRVSMDLIGLDVTEAPNPQPGDQVEILGPNQGIDALAAAADTIGYEVLTALGPRYRRRYLAA